MSKIVLYLIFRNSMTVGQKTSQYVGIKNSCYYNDLRFWSTLKVHPSVKKQAFTRKNIPV